MKRGFLLLDAVLALALMALLAGAAYPAVGQLALAAADLEHRLYRREAALFASDYLTDKIRHSRSRTAAGSVTSTACPITAYDGTGTLRTYTLLAETAQWKLRLYTGTAQPITGGEEPVPYNIYTIGGAPFFQGEAEGLVRLSYELRRSADEDGYEVSTAVLPLYDFFLVGDPYE